MWDRIVKCRVGGCTPSTECDKVALRHLWREEDPRAPGSPLHNCHKTPPPSSIKPLLLAPFQPSIPYISFFCAPWFLFSCWISWGSWLWSSSNAVCMWWRCRAQNHLSHQEQAPGAGSTACRSSQSGSTYCNRVKFRVVSSCLSRQEEALLSCVKDRL